MDARFTQREIKKIEKKRKGNNGIGWVIAGIVFGAAFLSSAELTDMSEAVISYVLGGLCLFFAFRHLFSAKSKARRWENIDAAINHRGNTEVSYIAKKTGYPTDKIRIDLQEMIRNHFFIGEFQDLDAYLDGELDMLIMIRYPLGTPLEAVKGKTDEVKIKMEKAREIPEIKALRRAISKVDDEDVKSSLLDLEGSVRRIEDHLIEKPELREKASVRKLKEYYLPQVITLVEKYEKGSLSEETLAEIKDVIGTCADAFQNMERNLLERDDLDTMVDIDVLKTTLSREGLLGSDFDVD